MALLTELFIQLGITKPELHSTVTVVFIVNEENGMVEGIGVDKACCIERMGASSVCFTSQCV